MVAAQSKIQAFLTPASIFRPGAVRPENSTAQPTDPQSAQTAAALRPADQVELSPQARQASQEQAAPQSDQQAPEDQPADPSAPTSASGEPLSDDQQRELRDLQKRDAEVRAHEQAHVAAAGALFRGGPTYDLQKGPDGKDYAVGGSVSIDSDPVPGDPEATIVKMQQVRRAALAPADPSSTDRRVAAQATKAEAQARQELAEQRAEEQKQSLSADPANPSSSKDKATNQTLGAVEQALNPEFKTGYTNQAATNTLKLPRYIDTAA